MQCRSQVTRLSKSRYAAVQPVLLASSLPTHTQQDDRGFLLYELHQVGNTAAPAMQATQTTRGTLSHGYLTDQTLSTVLSFRSFHQPAIHDSHFKQRDRNSNPPKVRSLSGHPFLGWLDAVLFLDRGIQLTDGESIWERAPVTDCHSRSLLVESAVEWLLDPDLTELTVNCCYSLQQFAQTAIPESETEVLVSHHGQFSILLPDYLVADSCHCRLRRQPRRTWQVTASKQN